MDMRKALAVGLVVALLSALLPLSVAAGTRQSWYLTDNVDTNPGWADRITLKGNETSEGGAVEVGGGTGVVWRSDEPALAEVSFGEGVWDGKIMLDRDTGFDLDEIVVQLGHLDDSAMTLVGETTLSEGRDKSWGAFYEIEITVVIGGFTVPEGEYLTVKVINNSATAIDVWTGMSHGWLESPVEDPGYPLPELPAIVLLAGGLVGLVGYLALQRRRGKVPVPHMTGDGG